MRRALGGKRVLITGASGGIGAALAAALARRGAMVAIAGRSRERLDAVAESIRSAGGTALPITADVTQSADRRAMFDTVASTWGGLDILINNAGVGAHGHFIDLDEEILRLTMEVNFFAMAENCRLAIPLLADGEQPLIVNVSSMAGRRGVPAWTEYSASKFAICGFSEAIRPELVRFDIDLLLAVPGLTQSRLFDNLLARKGRLPINHAHGIPAEVTAEKIVRAMEANKREVRIERQARLLLFLNWLAPAFVEWRMKKLVAKLYAPERAALAERRRQRQPAATLPFPKQPLSAPSSV